jgi:hypothetical protein
MALPTGKVFSCLGDFRQEKTRFNPVTIAAVARTTLGDFHKSP